MLNIAGKVKVLSQVDLFESLVEKRVQFNNEIDQYWEQFSNIDTWQFWACVAMLIIPLIILFVLLDRTRVFEIGFYGFSIHAITLYLDTYGIKEGLWGYPFQLSPYIVSNFTLDASLIPVTFMLIYQFTFHRSRLFYISNLAGIIAFAFILKPIYEN
ncbi:CBO0543 family protein [Cytobacillus luteolus]|uniref:CBO0543 family protein n=1 Tax=Litchfieldia luteola TaxID=682179 RepID=UPI001D0BEC5C|nr:CBO0543 family protein [Cytobacillus luteolus]